MNGLGIAGTLANLEQTLLKAKSLLKPGGQILCDSSDVKFLYEEEDGSYWMDLNAQYYGEFKFKMSYKKSKVHGSIGYMLITINCTKPLVIVALRVPK